MTTWTEQTNTTASYQIADQANKGQTIWDSGATIWDVQGNVQTTLWDVTASSWTTISGGSTTWVPA